MSSWIAAIVAGAALSGIGWAVATNAPGSQLSRFVMMTCYLGYSALFISETHGMIEFHFHIFGALAFMLIYRDWRVPVVGRRGGRCSTTSPSSCCRRTARTCT